jgi:two-component system response regulator PilR (NtrC family)
VAPRVEASPAEAAMRTQPVPAETWAPAAPAPLSGSLPDHLDKVERTLIRETLLRTGHDPAQAASLLGLTLRQLRYRMQRLEISDDE